MTVPSYCSNCQYAFVRPNGTVNSQDICLSTNNNYGGGNDPVSGAAIPANRLSMAAQRATANPQGGPATYCSPTGAWFQARS